MKENEFIRAHYPVANKFKPKLVARLWGGFSGRAMPANIKELANKHIKKAENGQLYINQYNDEFYERNFAKSRPEITDFASFWSILKPYFTVMRKDNK